MGAEEEWTVGVLNLGFSLHCFPFFVFCFCLVFFLAKEDYSRVKRMYYQQGVRLNEGGGGEINLSVCVIITYLHVIVHFWRVSVVCQASLVKP